MARVSNVLVGPNQAGPAKGGQQERLKMLKLTDLEIARACNVFACGPLIMREGDQELIEVGIFEKYEDNAVDVTGKGWGAAINFYNPDGTVREILQESAKLPKTDKEKYHNALVDKNNQKILIQQMENALIALLRNPNDSGSRDLAEKALLTWVEC